MATVQPTGGRPTVPGARRSSSGVATAATATSVDPYKLYSTAPNASWVRRQRSGDSEDPAAKSTFSDGVSYFAITSGPKSTMRCSIVGTSTTAPTRYSAIAFKIGRAHV